MFIVIKRNGLIKTRRVANGRYQKLHTESDFSLPIHDFYAVKYVCEVVPKEERDTAIVDLPRFFLQTGADNDEELLIIKLTGVIALLFIKYDE